MNDKDQIKPFPDTFINDMYRINSDLFYCAFEKYFENRNDFNERLSKLNDEKEEIIRLGFFYYVVTKEIKHAGVILISIFSIMEATADEKFQPFDQWLLAKIKEPESISFPITDQQDLKRTIVSLQNEYYAKHGSTEKVRSFVNRYFTLEDKQKLIAGFDIKDQSPKYKSLNFDERLKAFVDMLYKERNAFVHQGRLPQITDQSVNMLGYCQIKNKDVFVSIKLQINDVQTMFEKGFIEYLRKMGA
ncbi:MAG: hypothetical protein ACOZF0_11035 [Thermodesulfobacteriota bacterium]